MLSRSDILAYFDLYTYGIGHHGVRSIYNCYKKPSVYKKDIWRRYMNNKYCSVITYNRFTFTVGYLLNKDTDLYFVVETPSQHGMIVLGPNEKAELNRQGVKW